MTPKEKARYLTNKFSKEVYMMADEGLTQLQSKQCALIAVDEILETVNEIPFINQEKYWQDVKTEIKKQSSRI